jgi:hypothetical protein
VRADEGNEDDGDEVGERFGGIARGLEVSPGLCLGSARPVLALLEGVL